MFRSPLCMLTCIAAVPTVSADRGARQPAANGDGCRRAGQLDVPDGRPPPLHVCTARLQCLIMTGLAEPLFCGLCGLTWGNRGRGGGKFAKCRCAGGPPADRCICGGHGPAAAAAPHSGRIQSHCASLAPQKDSQPPACHPSLRKGTSTPQVSCHGNHTKRTQHICM